MELPKIAETSPIRIELEAGKTYAYCTCGLSNNQPFCNGSHKGTGFAPTIFTAEETKKRSICRCKKTGDELGFCDGSHKGL
ncbi:MAG: CDGSH iron-sulfur domain-containing protein [Bacteroidota bacterium]